MPQNEHQADGGIPGPIPFPSSGNRPGFTISPPSINLNPATTYESPFFWFILGAGTTVLVFHLIRKGHL